MQKPTSLKGAAFHLGARQHPRHVSRRYRVLSSWQRTRDAQKRRLSQPAEIKHATGELGGDKLRTDTNKSKGGAPLMRLRFARVLR